MEKKEYITFSELYDAYVDCRKRKRTTYNAQCFEINETKNLMTLYKELNSMTYEIDYSICFCVEKPVKREVFAADFRDRIVHHYLINKILPILEEEFIDDSYSCRKGKGSDYGIRQCYKYMVEASDNFTKDCYLLKYDLKSFFMTIDKSRLCQKLKDFLDEKYTFKDDGERKFLFYLLEKIVLHEPQNKCHRKQPKENWNNLPKEKSLFNCEKGFGLPIGNLTSQIFANFYLSEFDHYVKEELGCKYYGRYVDDFYIIIDDLVRKKKLEEAICIKLRKMGVTLHPNKRYCQHISKGIPFIGAFIKPNRTYIANRTKGNLYWKMVLIENSLSYMSEKCKKDLNYINHCVASINSYLGFLKHYRTYNIKKKILLNKDLKEIFKYAYFDKKLNKLTLFKEFKLV